MKKILIIANWKCNPTNQKEAKELFESVKKGVKNTKNVEVVICPPFLYIPILENLSSEALSVGGQNCFWEEKGAFTGEISALMLKNMGVEYVIIGHSERRKYFEETDEEINKKIKKALALRLKPILCVGETLEEKESGEKTQVLKSQIEIALNRVSRDEVKKVVIVYEPVWAIGTGNNCSIDETMSSVISIRQNVSRLYNREIADNMLVLYGGSVNSENSADYIKEAETNGLLVGGASLKAEEFVKIVKSAA